MRPVGKLSELSTYPQICQLIQELTEAGLAATAIAQALSDAGYCSAHATSRFGAQTIRKVQRQLALRAPRPRVRPRDGLMLNEWWPAELVRLLDIPRASLYHWIRQGLVQARQLDEPLHRWVVWADETEKRMLHRIENVKAVEVCDVTKEVASTTRSDSGCSVSFWCLVANCDRSADYTRSQM